jgi:hypothetical protein
VEGQGEPERDVDGEVGREGSEGALGCFVKEKVGWRGEKRERKM